MLFDLERVRENVALAGTEDLLDRATVFREGMEPAALDLIEAELFRRGVTAAEVNAHRQRREAEGLCEAGEYVARCHACPRPAVGRGWVWQRRWRWLPALPWRGWYCAEHRPGGQARASS